ncbi:MAG: BNR/Asp-box repeat-containing protein [Pseudomonas sp. BICA1-14]|nr:YCF48-related protein [[Pseudomonas] sp. BICA1-14]KJS76130.1 MAG: BNR/Asp-box repeat-containing protein [[Pseudomonas] sp. BICA1-14]
MLSLCGAFSLLLLAASAPAQAAPDGQARYSIESAKAVSSLLLDITEAGERLVAAGDRGHILYSDDGGASWMQAKVPTRQLLTAIDFVDGKHGWAVGHDALILATADGGESWTAQYEDREREAPLLDVWFEDTQHGIAVGAYGALLETIDGGQSWEDISERLDNEDGYHLNAIAHIQGSGLFVVGELGGMFRSGDMGETWERVESPYQGSFFGVVGGAEPGVVVAFGLRGHLFRSVDFGDSWEGIELGNGNGNVLESGLADGNLLRDGRIVVVGHGGAVLTSDDQGRSFKLFNRPDRRSLSGVTSDSQGNLILVGQGGVRIASPSGADLAPQQ